MGKVKSTRKRIHLAYNMLLGKLASWVLAWTSSPVVQPFTYNETTFLLHGEPFQILGGQMDPQRVPEQYWRHRLQMARAMGLNTIFINVFWNQLEPSPGEWHNDQANDMSEFCRLAQEEGLWIVLRPGPYACAERDYGGLPAWISRPSLVVRSNNEAFLEQSKGYLSRLGRHLADSQITHGGPILMVQVENEYGSYGEDHKYVAALRDILRAAFDVPLYTNDGGVSWTLDGGSTPGALAIIDGDPKSGFAARDEYVTDPSRLGPQVDGEYYTFAADVWGANQEHQAPDRKTIQRIVTDVQWILNASASLNFYMLHGGSNFGFSNGALWQNRSSVFTSSYDFGAPIDESGRPTQLYWALRKTLGGTALPPTPPLMAIPRFTLEPRASLFEGLESGRHSEDPLTMEAMGQAYGYILYEHKASVPLRGTLRAGDRPRDRIQVYVNDQPKGVVDSQYQWPRNITLDLQPGDNLKLLVENLGRVDYYSRESTFANHLLDPYKGIVGQVTIGDEIVKGWTTHSISLDVKEQQTTQSSSPMFFKGYFNVSPCGGPMSRDTYLSVDGVRGQVFVNGVHLGRYWNVGPQQSLYLPGTLVYCDRPNEVVVFEQTSKKGNLTAAGVARREWFNQPDSECEGCILPPETKAPGQHKDE